MIAAGTAGCYSVDYRPLFEADAVTDDMPDNLHPSSSAQARMAQYLYDQLFA